ncbi:MAG: I78 family peptidase inhibitor [Alphaproteobacteria bacterium]
MIRAGLMGLVLVLAACNTPEQTQRDLDQIANREQAALGQHEGQANPQDTCGMAAYQGLIGHPESEIDRSKLPPRARVILPGQMVTQDFAPGRLNIRISPDRTVANVSCG